MVPRRWLWTFLMTLGLTVYTAMLPFVLVTIRLKAAFYVLVFNIAYPTIYHFILVLDMRFLRVCCVDTNVFVWYGVVWVLWTPAAPGN